MYVKRDFVTKVQKEHYLEKIEFANSIVMKKNDR